MTNFYKKVLLSSSLLTIFSGPSFLISMERFRLNTLTIPMDEYGSLDHPRMEMINSTYRRLPKKPKTYQEKLDEKLKKAIKSSNFQMVKEALDAGANPNAEYITSASFEMPLMMAVYEASEPAITMAMNENRVKIIELLLKNKANVNAYGKNRVTPLGIAIEYLKYDPSPIINILLAYGANIYHKDSHGISLLEEAMSSGAPVLKKIMDDYVKLLNEVLQIRNPEKYGYNSNPHNTLRKAIKGDYHLLVKLLIQLGVPVDESDLELAKSIKPYPSIRSGRYILNQLRFVYPTCPIGTISKKGFATEPELPNEVWEKIGRYTH